MPEMPDLMTWQASQSLELSSMYSSSHLSPTGRWSFWTRRVNWVWKDRRRESVLWMNWIDMKLVVRKTRSRSSIPRVRNE